MQKKAVNVLYGQTGRRDSGNPGRAHLGAAGEHPAPPHARGHEIKHVPQICGLRVEHDLHHPDWYLRVRLQLRVVREHGEGEGRLYQAIDRDGEA